MTDGSSFASLGPMLLARKGTAKPAMRVELTQGDRTSELGDSFDTLAHSQSALGWNDMGDDDHVVPFRGAAERDLLLARKSPKPRRRAFDRGRRAAFTLRLDAERHMKLRLASTLRDCSSQQLVTEALDRFLSEIPELDSIAAHIAGKTIKS
ncbi:hypothetical protein [Aurantiacibacter poecillastricola]|uniref:hypothetical protein n=1 Tax=Aurantiacibacter poecillastricola TaxID=3064385 RepID=UPI00273E74DE|nr:hypothetical protein [Aurantiacibacter sp. 219JJ12-13]MDP5262755.1 hypothetical protein [Aurantiacibacter sp. 219JJ12-13]